MCVEVCCRLEKEICKIEHKQQMFLLKCAGEYKMRFLSGQLKFYHNVFLLECALESKVRLCQEKLKFKCKLSLFFSVSNGIKSRTWCRNVIISE